MKELTIETANKKRNRYVLWAVIGLPFIYLPIVFPETTADLVSKWISFPVELAALILTVTGCIKLIRISTRIKRSPEIHNALKGEIFQVYQRKALMTGFFTMIGLLAILIPLSDYTDITLRLASRLLFFAGIFSFLVSWLIYNWE
ncbi:MAG: hypothetical protein LUE10_09440 [Alistipes sp.]|nr:hypothetical protein [Alistipes sp.]